MRRIYSYDDFTSTEMRLKNYVKDGTLDKNELLNDVQRILAYIDISPPKYMIKEPDSNVKCNCIVEISQSDCQKKISTIKFNLTDKKKKKRVSCKRVEFYPK